MHQIDFGASPCRKIADSAQKMFRMRKFYLIVVLVLGCFVLGNAQYKAGYYSKMDGKSAAALKQAAKECVSAHVTLDYSELPNYWQYSDIYPELVNGCKRWWEMYSDKVYLIYSGQTGRTSFSANKMQREHSVPKSWWKLNGSVEYTPAYSDMWNLYPSDGTANQAKLAYPLGPTASAFFDNGVTKVGEAQTGYGGGSRNVFEPGDDYKGDFARAYMYMATVYDDINWVVNYMFKKESYPTLQSWAVEMLLDWSRRDPVDQKEIDRNNVVEQYQGNRNPFVDFPELAEYIWGTRTSEVFRLEEQEDVNPTPPITGDPELTQPVNGEVMDFGQVAQGRSETRVLQIIGKNFTAPLSVSVSGTGRANFQPAVTSIPASTLNQNQGYMLSITYSPTEIGAHTAKISLFDGGLADDRVISVTIQGESLPMPEFTTLTALEPADLTADGYTARWNPVQNGTEIDYYLLTRVRYVDDSQEIETFETTETSYPVEGREVGVAESYYVQYSRLGMLSEPSNEIYIAGSSVGEHFVNSRIQIFTIGGGFAIKATGEDNPPIHVYDINGIEVLTIPVPRSGDTYSLPQGVYLLISESMKPFKLIL